VPKFNLRSIGVAPAIRVSIGLVSLVVGIMLALDLIFAIFPDQTALLREERERKSENLAVQIAVLARADNVRPLLKKLHVAMIGDADISSIAVRLVTGEILAEAGNHAQSWVITESERSNLENVRVPLLMDSEKWGDVEISFHPATSLTLIEWLRQPKVLVILLLAISGFVLFSLYLRRVLEHLDPSSVVPDRVRQAFDSFAQGVMIVDPQSRILLANETFRGWAEFGDGNLIGRRAEDLRIFKDILPSDTKEHPWMIAMAQREQGNGEQFDLIGEGGAMIKTVPSCAPILDGRDGVRGCIVSFNDLTELDKKNKELTAAMRELEDSRVQIETQNEELRKLATRDPLTGCLNRRAFHELADKLFAESNASGKPLWCIMTDVDHFKSFNDRFGHAIGDAVLQAVSRCLFSGLRDNDLLCRYGGEEFCIVLMDVTLEEAQQIADRLRTGVATKTAKGLRGVDTGKVTCSFGLAELTPDVKNPSEIMDRADKALYVAKESGRDCVKVWQPEALLVTA
jgi:diguanylate cyclase (GGDEF)-like protein